MSQGDRYLDSFTIRTSDGRHVVKHVSADTWILDGQPVPMALMALKKKVCEIMRDMTEGSAHGHLWRYALPLLLGNWLQLAYNAVDSIIAGRFIG